jgi:hypothetical protein
MTLNFKNLNVASLDYTDIVNSLKTFLKQEPTLSDLDFDNSASAVSLLCDILATATAYNGIYAQFGYHESFLSTANLLESIVGIASNSSVLLEVKNSAACTRNVSTTVAAGFSAYHPFTASATDGSEVLFFNTINLPGNTSLSVDFYCGQEVVQFTNWDFNSQSMTIPLTVDPRTINLYSVNTSGNSITWTKVAKSDQNAGSNQYFYSVLNTVNGYLVSANLPESFDIPTNYIMFVKAVLSNGSQGNNSTLNTESGLAFLTNEIPSGGYDSLTVEQARAKVQFAASSQHRCVTLNDFVIAILNSGIPGTENEDKITVANGTDPCTINVYVTDMDSSYELELMNYLGEKAVAGVNLIYTL